MKENTRNIIAALGLTFMLFMTFGFIYKYCTAIKTLELKDSEENIKQLNVYKTEANKITNEKCKDAVNNLIEHYEKTSFNGDVSISNLKTGFLVYDDGFTHSSITGQIFSSLFDNCLKKVEKDEETKMIIEINNSYNITQGLEEELVRPLGTSQFAIGSSFYVYDYAYSPLAPVIYDLHRTNYLDLIDNVIKYEKVRGEYNE